MATLRHIDDNETIREKRQRELNPKTELGREFIRQFRDAAGLRHSIRVGDYMLGTLLHECKKARDDEPTSAELSFREKYPAWTPMPISLVAFKVNLLVAMLRENLVDVSTAPFIIDPTPNPEIPASEKQRVLSEVYKDLLAKAEDIVGQQIGFADVGLAEGVSMETILNHAGLPTLNAAELIEDMRQRKGRLLAEIRKHAEDQAAMLQRELYDKSVEGGWREAFIPFIDDFATYPYACIHGPIPTIKTEARWAGDKFKEEQRVTWSFERVSPFDFYWTNDSTSAQDGTAIFIKKMVGYEYLFDALEFAEQDEQSGYDKTALNELIEMLHDGGIPRFWSGALLSPENNDGGAVWLRGDTAEIIIRYGKHTGRELLDFGFADLKPNKVYETKSIMCGGKVIYLTMNNNPSQYKRPVFCTSFETRNGSIVGVGLAQRLLSLHKAYRTVMQLCMYHLGYLSEPISIVDYKRIMEFMGEDWVENPAIYPGMTIVTGPDTTMRGDKPVSFMQIPNSTDSLLRMADHLFELSHVVSNIPAALHGQPVGSGANRTVRGLLTLQGNALKSVQSSLINLDRHVVEPMVTLLYMQLVKHDDDFEYTGDCKIVAKGAASMIERELKAQQAMENLQIIGQVGAHIPPEILAEQIEELLRVTGILKDGQRLPPPQPALPLQAAQGVPPEALPAEPTPPMQ